MKTFKITTIIALAAFHLTSSPAISADVCSKFGPQTPRDISSKEGTNKYKFGLTGPISNMNLCNIHYHTNAEHKGPGFPVLAGKGKYGGFKCKGTPDLSKAELKDPTDGKGACKGLKPGDTVEVHWVHSSCDVSPGKGLGSCLSKQCANPQLRVEAQVFLVVNDPQAANFLDFAYQDNTVNGFHQAKALPKDTGTPVLFQGSTTGPKYTQEKCSPLQVTWNVRPNCAKVDISSLHKWCENNVFKENYAHGVRQLVTAKELLAEIK